MLKNNNIKVAMLEMSSSNRGILEFYFDTAGKSHYKVVDEASADAFIIDYDQFGAKEHVSEILAERELPLLLVSIREQSIDSTVWLPKPLSAESLNTAASTVKDMLVEIEAKNKAAEKQNELEAETATTTTNEKTEEDQSLADEFIAFDDAIESFDTADTTERQATVSNNIETNQTSLETNNAQEESKLGSTLAMSGVAASALVTSSLIGDDYEDDGDLLDFDVVNNHLESNDHESDVTELTLDEKLDNDLSNELSFEEAFDSHTDENMEAFDAETTNTNEVSDNDEVDNLLDSMMFDEDELSSTEETAENIKSDIFLDELVADEEADNSFNDTIIDSKTENELEIDVFQTVDSELEESQKVIELTTEHTDSIDLLEDESTTLIEENFTLHDDLNPSTEDVFADTLEVSYEELKSDLNKIESEKANPATAEVEALNKELNDSLEEPTSIENDLDVNLGEPVDTGFDFNFDALDNTEFNSDSSEVRLETPDTVELETTSNNEIELTLLDESDQKSTEDSSATTDDFLNDDLDSLLQDISDENEGIVADTENELHTDASEHDTDLLLAEVSQTLDESSVEASDNDDIDDLLDDDLGDEDLQSLLNEVRQEANGVGSDSSSNESPVEQTKAEKRWMQLCGNETVISNQKEVANLSFDPSKHLLSVVLEQIETTKTKEQLFRLKYEDLIIVIDHATSKIYCNIQIDSDDFSVVCSNEIDTSKVKIHDLDYSEERLYKTKIEKSPNRAHSFESFIWVSSLLTSRGRLPENTNITKTVGLKTWPNLTRLELIPHAMNMAAVFSKHPGSLLEITKWLEIPQKYVFAFYNAALSLDMIEFDIKQTKKSGFSFGKKNSQDKSEERGFFGRLLKRLKT